MELAEYTKKLRTFAESYFHEDKLPLTSKRCCVSFKRLELSIICIDRHANIDEILIMDKIKFDQLKSLPLILKGMIDKHQLQITPLSWLLGPEDYQLNLIEAMPVPEHEFKTALTWRIRSLITYPVEEAVMESFELPSKKNTPGSPLICAITAQKTKLSPAINAFKEAGFNMAKIDIPELAMLNLSSLHETDERSTAFLYFYEKYIIMNISYKKTLYFTRRINIETAGDAGMGYEKLSLEILRYFDFFRSQWRLTSPTRIFAATEYGDIATITKVLTERLLNPVEPYNLPGTILDEKAKNQITAKYLLDYGSLLKQETIDVTTGN